MRSQSARGCLVYRAVVEIYSYKVAVLPTLTFIWATSNVARFDLHDSCTLQFSSFSTFKLTFQTLLTQSCSIGSTDFVLGGRVRFAPQLQSSRQESHTVRNMLDFTALKNFRALWAVPCALVAQSQLIFVLIFAKRKKKLVFRNFRPLLPTPPLTRN